MWLSEKFLQSNYQKNNRANKKEFFRLVADEALDYVQSNTNIYFLEQFLVKRGIPKDRWYNWRKKSEHIQKAHELIMMELSSRITYNGANNIANAHFIKFLLPRYGEDHKQHAEYMSNLQSKDESDGNIVIEIPTFKKSKGDTNNK